MVGIPNPLAMFHQHHEQHRSSREARKASSAERKRKPSKPDEEEEDENDEPQLLPEVASKFSSSCEIFNVFKVLAAGKKGRQSLDEEVDTDESEDEDTGVAGGSTTATLRGPRSEEGSLRHVGSTRTVRPADTLNEDDESDGHDEDDDGQHTLAEDQSMDKDEALRRWQSSFGSNTAELDAQGNRLAGKLLNLEELLMIPALMFQRSKSVI